MKMPTTTTAPATAKADNEATLAQVKPRRRPWLWALAVLLVALGALLAAQVVAMLRDTVPVVVAAQDIDRGAVITAEALTTVEVHPDPVLRTIPAAELDSMIGKVALVDIPMGGLLVPDTAGGEIVPVEGEALVGIALTPPQLPSGELHQGQAVQLVSVPRQGDDVPAEEAAVTIEATVISTAPIQDTNMVVVNVTVEASLAEKAAALSATGRVALIVKGI